MIRFELHLPIAYKTAKKRRMPQGFALLLVEITGGENVEDRLSEFIHIAGRDSRYMIAQSLTPYRSSKSFMELLNSRGLRCRLDKEINDRVKRAQNVVVDCQSKEDIAFVLKNILTEGLVYYGEKGVRNRPDVQRQLVEAGRDGYIESGFLELINAIPIFIFYSSTHESIEIFGKPESIKSLFFTYCERRH